MAMPQARASEILRRIVPWRLPEATKGVVSTNYKGVRGRIGIVGGAKEYAGAPYFASMAVMRLGADLSYVICSSTASQAIKNFSPDLIVMPLLDCPSESEFVTEIDCLLSRLHALVIGPGLSREKLLQSRAKKLIEEARARSIPLVLDADGLILVNEDPSIIKSYSRALLTPNRIELQRLSNILFAPKTFDLRSMQTEEVERLVRQCSSHLDVTILAKGVVDIINSGGADPSDTIQVKTDPHLGSNRRCGGQGDLLSGMAAVYLHWINEANKLEKVDDFKIEHPTVWAGYLAAMTTRHCNAIAYKEFQDGMLASNMVDKVHLAFNAMLLSATEANSRQLKRHNQDSLGTGCLPTKGGNIRNAKYTGLLTQDEISRYKRQIIMDEFGPERQLKLKKASALIIGAGGLGCPSAVYLGAGGIGRLGIVDDDLVETSNLHRQILHNINKVGMLKSESIKEAVLAINPNVIVETHSVRMTRDNAVELVEGYDIVIDATDNLKTRYMISDACVVAKKPLVSGAALKMDGQLTVYNYDATTPCFRCLFPKPPPPNAVGSCTDNGVLGVLPGIIGVHQALETMKIGAGLRPAYAGKMLLFDGQLGLFRHAKLGERKSDCQACGPSSKLGRNLINYDEFCGETACKQQPLKQGSTVNDILEPSERVTCEDYRNLLESNEAHILVDVRPLSHSSVSRFEHAIPLPVAKLLNEPEDSLRQIKEALKSKRTNQIYVVCRKGIASQRGTRAIQDLLRNNDSSGGNDCKFSDIVVKDIIGGMTAWAERVDPSFSCL